MKKIVCLCVTVLMTINILTAPKALSAADFETGNRNVDILMALSGVDKTEAEAFIPEDVITKGEFIDILMRILGITDIASGTYIADVDSDNPYYNSIYAAKSCNIINGDENGLFYPDDIITYHQAKVILVNVLGGREIAMNSGGYVQGYSRLSSELGFTKGVNVEDSDNLQKKEAAKLIVNALDEEMFLSYFGGQSKTVERKEKLLFKYRGIVHSKGVLEATQYTELTNALSGKSKFVKIDNVQYLCDFDVGLCLGRVVDYYYEKDDERLIYAAPIQDDTIIINAEDIDYIYKSDRSILYYKDESHTRTAKVTIPWSAKMIYNFRAKTDYTMDTFDIISGTIVIASSANGSNDIVYITEYDSLLVDNISPADKILSDKYDISLNLKLNEDEMDYVSIYDYSTGKQADFSDIVIGDVVSVIRSEDERIAEAYIVRETMETDIFSVDDSGAYTSVTTPIDEYKVHKKTQLIAQLKKRGYGKLYLDISGTVAGFTLLDDKDNIYAFVIDGKVKKRSEEVQIRYLDSSGSIETVIHNCDYTKVDNKKLVKYGESLPGVLTGSPQLVRLSLGEKWLNIDTINTTEYEDAMSLTLLLNQESAIAYMSASHNLGGKAILSDSTKVMKIPTKTITTALGTEKVIDVSNEAGFEAGEVKNFLNNTEKYAFKAYNADPNSYTPDVIVLHTSLSVAMASPIMLVKKVIRTLNEDNEPRTAVIGYYEDQEVTIIDADQKPLESLGLKKGDIVQYKKDVNGNIASANKMFDAGTHTFTPPPSYNSSDYGNAFQIRHDYAYKAEGNNLFLSGSSLRNEKLSNLEIVPLGTKAVYRVSSSGAISKISLGDVKTFVSSGKAEYAFCMLRYGVGRIVVVYEN